ncbi:MAG TPA: alpha/beta fold hydrolase [Solirubrobacteraceae bacterium]|nr:alpha/beta fold hydrolase [Solirubrobacteraceae bacterium]
MLRAVKGAALATAASLALLLATSANALGAASPVAFTPCAAAPDFGCAHLTVPLDPANASQGTITLSIERKVAVTGNATQAIVGLAGGPGQAAIPFAEDFSQTLSSALGTRDLVVFDQRGTGTSGALSCPAFANPAINFTATLVGECASELGATRGDYTSDDSVADIEAIREALGYSQLYIYGTSYGTKVALRYAQQYPSYTAGLILDSTVEPDGPDVYGADSFAAIPGMLADLCAHDACADIGDPMSDLEAVVERLNKGPVHTRFVEGDGHVKIVKINSDDVFNILISGDLAPVLRANLPGALAAAAHGDYALLAQLNYIANEPEGGIDDELYLATTCEELPFPWTRGGTPSQLAAEALAAFAALPASTFAPFTAQTAYDESDEPYCAGWPFATAAPESSGSPLPNVPTLIISGTEDMRTPTADARTVAAEIPDSTLLVVPNTGHSVLGTEPTDCAQNALNAFFTGATIEQCTDTKIPSFLRPTQTPPHSIGHVRAAPGTSGLPGRTVTAAVDTVNQALEFGVDNFISGSSLTATVHFGGLRAGFGAFSLKGLKLHSYSYIPGVVVSGVYGSLKGKSSTLTVSGPNAAAGTLTFDFKHKTVKGVLGGVAVSTTDKALERVTKSARASAARVGGYGYARRLGGAR